MGHTAPDWSWMGRLATVYNLQDMAELAVRTRSPHAFDRRGNVIWLTEFDRGLQEVQGLAFGVGSSLQLACYPVDIGGYSATLTTGPLDGCEIDIFRRFPIPVLGKVGLEHAFWPGPNWSHMALELNYWDGTERQRYAVRYVYATQAWEYPTSLVAWAQFAVGRDWFTSYNFWHKMKLVVDLQNKQYVRFIADRDVYTIPGAPVVLPAPAIQPVFEWKSFLTGDGTGVGYCYVDSVIFTQNEL